MVERMAERPAMNSDVISDLGAKPTEAAPIAAKRRPRIWWRRFKWTVRIAFLAWIVSVFVFGCDGRFYYPSRSIVDTPATYNLKYEDVSFKAKDGVKLSGWFMPAKGAARGTVIHFHGNAENMSTHVAFVFWVPTAGYNLLTFDYRGYGTSEGSVTRAGTVLDGHAALDYVLSRADVDPKRVYVIGQSLGGAVATVVAANRPEIRALVLDSAFSSYRRIAQLHLRRILHSDWLARAAVGQLISDTFEPMDVIAKIAPRPLLVIASECDEICFPELARELFDAAGEPKTLWSVPGASHTEAFSVAAQQFQERIIRCFESADR